MRLMAAVHQELQWPFPAHSASWMNSCSSCSFHCLLKALGVDLLHIRMWGCNYSYQVKDEEQQRNTTVFFPLPPLPPLPQTTGLPGFAIERVGIFCTNHNELQLLSIQRSTVFYETELTHARSMRSFLF